MDEETRLASSDLEDCQEVWLPELGDYILETKKRQNQVAQYFWASILVSLFYTFPFPGVDARPIPSSSNRSVIPKLRKNYLSSTIPRFLESLFTPRLLMLTLHLLRRNSE